MHGGFHTSGDELEEALDAVLDMDYEPYRHLYTFKRAETHGELVSIPGDLEEWPCRRNTLGMENVIATIPSLRRGSEASVPILLVAFTREGSALHETMLAYSTRYKSRANRRRLFVSQDHSKGRISAARYIRSVNFFLSRSSASTSSINNLLLAALSPLVHNYLLKARDDSFDNCFGLQARAELRKIIEDAENNIQRVLSFAREKAKDEVLGEEMYRDIQTGSESLILKARRLEAGIRDQMQLQVGELALEESRRSIVLSNAQIKDARSVKLSEARSIEKEPHPELANKATVTILAFVYIPLNLTTSIFGMNVHEINDGGHGIWAFLPTAVLALMITGTVWLYVTSDKRGNDQIWARDMVSGDRSKAF